MIEDWIINLLIFNGDSYGEAVISTEMTTEHKFYNKIRVIQRREYGFRDED